MVRIPDWIFLGIWDCFKMIVGIAKGSYTATVSLLIGVAKE
jgi:hypothetical protein